ncbi:centrosomal protein of 162 kDa isoform X4 [Hydra vulgaris]|uniref:Centrosomal protein of 162 kDa n=1 Tax=Hydra vulgaris TaxID=6087 RepID=A0ABM4B8H5_HYDVU
MSSSNWKKLKSKIKGASFDDEFEKFMNESLSDDSGNSPRRSITPLKSRLKSINTPKDKVLSEKQWESEDDFGDSVLADIVNRKWNQSKFQDNESMKEKNQENNHGMIRDSLESPAVRSGALDTILSEVEYSIHESDSQSDKENASVSMGNESSIELPLTNKPLQLSELSENNENNSELSDIEQAEVDTEDIKNKENFFSVLEKDGDIDFRQLNDAFDKANGIKSSNQSDEEDNEYNEKDVVEVLGLTPYKPTHYDDEDDEEEDNEDITNFKILKIENDASYFDTSNLGGSNVGDLEKSLLSKVNLMESLDSTKSLHVAERLKAKKIKEKLLEDINEAEGKEVLHSKRLFGLNLKDNEYQENVINDLKTVQPVQSGMLVLDQKDTQLIQLNELSLQPVMNNFAEDPKPTLFQNNIEDKVSLNSQEFNEVEAIKKIGEFSNLSQNTLQHNISAYNDSSFKNTNENNQERESESPPSESLKSIKSIAAEKKKKLLETKFQIQNKIDLPATKVFTSSSKSIPVPKISKNNGGAAAFKKKKPIIKDREKKTVLPRRIPVKVNSPAAVKVAIKPAPKQLKNKSPLKPSPSSKSSKLELSRNESSKLEDSQVLISSVASFASYLKDFAQSSQMKTSFHEIDQNSHLAALDREAALQKELQDVRILYDDERRRSEKLNRDLLHKEKEWRNEKDKLMFEHDARLKCLHDEILVLKKKNLIDESHLSAEKKHFNEISKEDLDKLHSQLEQQEQLLNGYQQENQKLYHDLKKINNEKKLFEAKLVKENQRLASDLGNLREQLDARTNYASPEGTAALGAQRINQLENQVKFYQKREIEYKQEILDLEKEVKLLKDKAESNKNFEKENNILDHDKNLIEKLQKKVSWYAENQELLDLCNSQLNSKKMEVEQLLTMVKKLEDENDELRTEKQDAKTEKNNNGKEISELKRQIKEMESVLKHRQPSSLSSVMYVASAVPGETKAYNPQNLQKNKLDHFLENRIKSLENELEAKDNDYSTKVRALEQCYNSMSIRYEEHTKLLEGKISELTNQIKVNNPELTNQIKINNFDLKKKLQDDNAKLQHEVSKNTVQDEFTQKKESLILDEKEKPFKADYFEKKKSGKDPLSCNTYIVKLKEKLLARDHIINELQQTVSLLQKERENVLRKNQSKTMIEKNSSQDPTNKDLKSKCNRLKEKNISLKTKVEELLLLCEEKRLKYEAIEAELLRDKRNMEEQYEDQIQKILNEHDSEIRMLKMNYVMEHSNSKIAELNGKVESGELMITHLKGIVEDLKEDQEKLRASKQTEENLRRDIRQFEAELFEARKLYTPEIRHYKELENKIYNMELKRHTRENEIRTLLEKTKIKSDIDVQSIEEKWRNILKQKDDELRKFREELDSILEILQELQRQGVILPNRKLSTFVSKLY